MLSDVMWGIYYFYKSTWVDVGRYLEKGFNDLTGINQYTHFS